RLHEADISCDPRRDSGACVAPDARGGTAPADSAAAAPSLPQPARKIFGSARVFPSLPTRAALCYLTRWSNGPSRLQAAQPGGTCAGARHRPPRAQASLRHAWLPRKPHRANARAAQAAEAEPSASEVSLLPASPLAESLGAAATRVDRGHLSCRFAV